MKKYSFDRGKRILSFTIALVILITSVLSQTILLSGALGEKIWDGTAAESYAGGTGTQADPYLVSNGEQLLKMMNDGKKAYDAKTEGSYYKLTDDIYLNDISDFDDWSDTNAPANNWGSDSKSTAPNFYNKDFTGNVDGQGHTIYGLYCKETVGTHYKGLFSQISGSLIKNLNLSKVYVSGVNPSGAITGRLTNQVSASVISGCSVTDAKIVSTKAAGGFVGANSGSASTITDCSFKGSVSAGTMAGGIIGDGWSAKLTVSYCYTVGVYPCGDNEPNNYGFTNVYTDTAYGTTNFAGITILDSAQMQGENALSNMKLSSRLWQTTETYPITILPRYEVWDGSAAESYAGGDGTEKNPFLIENSGQFLKMIIDGGKVYNAKDTARYYRITNDIYLNDIFDFDDWSDTNAPANNWGSDSKSTAPNFYNKDFTGNVDGQGHTVYGLYCKEVVGTHYKGLFSQISGSEIKNLNISKAYFNTKKATGAIAGRLTNNVSASVISGCSVTDTKIISTTQVGGIVGANASTTSTISNCAFVGSVSADNGYVGGIVGDGWTAALTVDSCYTVGAYPCGDDAAEKGFYNFSNVYTDTDYAKATETVTGLNGIIVLKNAQMQGENALETMSLNSNLWKATEAYPLTYYKLPDVWDGTTADSFAGGKGTEKSPYLVSTGEQLAKMISDGKLAFDGTEKPKYYKLTNDIYLNDISDYKLWSNIVSPTNNWGAGSDYAKDFSGNVDGDGYTIYGLYIKEENGTYYKGLFSQLKDSVIENLNISNAYIYAKNTSGAIAGCTTGESSVLSKCSVINTVINAEGETVGGIIGTDSVASTVKDCYFIGENQSLTGEYTGGIIGDSLNDYITVKDSYSVNYYPFGNNKDDKSNLKNSNFVNVYTDTGISGSDEIEGITVLENSKIKGINALENMNLSISTWVATVAYPTFYEKTVWNGTSASSYAGGDGTKESPYLINTAEQLYKMVSEHCVEADPEVGAYYEIISDILLNDTTEDTWYENINNKMWYTNRSSSKGNGFRGHLNGNGHYIYGLYAKNISSRTGLIPVLGDGADVINVHIRDAYMSGDGSAATHIGGIGGFVVTGASVDIVACSSKNIIITNAQSAGGIIGGNAGTLSIDRSYFVGTLSDSVNMGGIYADSWASAHVTECYSVDALLVGKSYYLTDAVRYSTVDQQAEGNAKESKVGLLTAEKMCGDNAQKYMKGFDFKDSWIIIDEDYPHISVIDYNANDGAIGEVWTGKKSLYYAGGNGTEADPFVISTGEQLFKMILETSMLDDVEAWYVLTDNILLNDTTDENWINNEDVKSWFTVNLATRSFRGHFDGQGHVVSGLYSKTDVYAARAGLFPVVDYEASIMNVGITNSYIETVRTSESFAAALVGYARKRDEYATVAERDAGTIDIDKMHELATHIKCCFADDTVTVVGMYAGGIVSGLPGVVFVEDCYFTGTLKAGSLKYGGIVGNSWMPGNRISNTYCATQNLDYFSGGYFLDMDEAKTGHIRCEGCYNFGLGVRAGVQFMPLENMRGEAAKENMIEFDFDNVWQVVDGGTPVLKIFGENADIYSEKGGRKVTVSFATNSGEPVDSITGNAGEEGIKLPTPTRYGYIFDGWYVYQELQCEYRDTCYPYVDLMLYAKWKPNSIMQDFENYPNTEYDIDEDYEYYRPGQMGYTPQYVQSGGKSLHLKGNSGNEQDFLVCYEDTLVVGKDYEMTFWVCSDETNVNYELSLLHATWPDIAEPILDVEKLASVKSLENGKWKKYTYKFTAKTRWVSIRANGKGSLYFDDIMFAVIN